VYPAFRCCVLFDSPCESTSLFLVFAVGINERDVTILSYTFNFQLSIIVCSYLPFVSYPYPYRSVTVNSFFLLTYYRSVISSPCIILLLDICLRSVPYVILPLVYPSNVYVIVYRRNI